MKLKFKHQKLQELAVNAVADLFTGQEKKTATFSTIQGDRPAHRKYIYLAYAGISAPKRT